MKWVDWIIFVARVTRGTYRTVGARTRRVVISILQNEGGCTASFAVPVCLWCVRARKSLQIEIDIEIDSREGVNQVHDATHRGGIERVENV